LAKDDPKEKMNCCEGYGKEEDMEESKKENKSFMRKSYAALVSSNL